LLGFEFVAAVQLARLRRGVCADPVPPDDDLATKQAILDEQAALARYQCYKFFGAEMPPDGGKPTLTPMVRAAKEKRGEGVEW